METSPMNTAEAAMTVTKHTAELKRRTTGTLFYHILTPEELTLLRDQEELFCNMLEHENPGFTVVRVYRGK